jgi:hypothetical protein
MKKEQFYSKHQHLGVDQKELERKYRLYLREQEETRMLYEAAMKSSSSAPPGVAGGGGSGGSGGDLTLVFSSFDTVDALLAGGFDSLPDWNAAIVGAGNPYTSISVDEPNFTVYLSGGSNITLAVDAFNGIFEGGLGLGEDLISITDTGAIKGTVGGSFYQCSILETVILPALGEVKLNDFYYCVKLKNVQLPLVAASGDNAFFGAFNTADSPITLNLPDCTTFGTSSFLHSDGFGGYIGTTEVDSPKVMNATFSNSVIANPEITLLLAENSGIVPAYV